MVFRAYEKQYEIFILKKYPKPVRQSILDYLMPISAIC